MNRRRLSAQEEAERFDRWRAYEDRVDAEMARDGIFPGSGLPFDGMPAEWFPDDPDLYPDERDERDELRELYDMDAARYEDFSEVRGESDGADDSASAAAPRSHSRSRSAVKLDQAIDSLVAVEGTLARLAGQRADLLDEVRRLSADEAAHHDAACHGAAYADETSADTASAARARAGRPGASNLAQRSLRAELSAALRIPERTVESMLGVARSLVNELPATLAALKDGEISYRHAQIMVDHASGLPDDERGILEGEALPHARRLTATRFNRKARVLRERLRPDTIAERHERAIVDRDVRFDPARDGMAELTVLLPAAQALAIYNRITDAARGLQGPGECRTLAQLRADVFADVMLAGADDAAGRAGRTRRGRSFRPHSVADRYRGIAPRIYVTVPVLSLLGVTEQPASLDGYGPIDADTARQLARNAPSMVRVLTDPETGAVLSVGGKTRRIPKDLKRWLRMRDKICRFPGCGRDASSCEIDHTIQWRHSRQTAHFNLAHLCPAHHGLKDETEWAVTHSRDGTGRLDWVSPTGRSYSTEPDTVIESGVADTRRRAAEAEDAADGPAPF